MRTDRFVSRNERSISDILYNTIWHLQFFKKRTRGSSVLIKDQSIEDQFWIVDRFRFEVAPLIGVIFVPDALIRIVSFVDGSERGTRENDTRSLFDRTSPTLIFEASS